MGLSLMGSGLNLLESSKYFGFNKEVGILPSSLVASAGDMKLLKFSSEAPSLEVESEKPPLLVVPSLINRYYILDLLPEKSFLRFLSKSFSVYLIDWGEPKRGAQNLSVESLLELHFDLLYSKLLAVEQAESVHMMGHCLGGDIALLWSLICPEKVKSLTLLTTPIDFSAEGKLNSWAHSEALNLQVFQEAYGNAPWFLMQGAFHALRPLQPLHKLRRLLPQLKNKKVMDSFTALETWSADSRDVLGGCYKDLIQNFYRENCLIKAGFNFLGKNYLLSDLKVPVASVAAEDDHIVPFAGTLSAEQVPAATAFAKWTTRGGHIGGLLGREAQQVCWPELAAWIKQQGPVNVQ